MECSVKLWKQEVAWPWVNQSQPSPHRYLDVDREEKPTFLSINLHSTSKRVRVRSSRRCFTAIPRYLAPSPLYIATWKSKQSYVLECECSYLKMLYCDTSRSTWRFCAMPAEKQNSLFFLAVDIPVAIWTRLWLVESRSRHLLLSQDPITAFHSVGSFVFLVCLLFIINFLHDLWNP